MRINMLHNWDVSIADAPAIQRVMASRIIREGTVTNPRLIVGFDMAVRFRVEARAVAIVLSYPSLEIVETAVATGTLSFPYVPGLLSFREVPLTLQACEKLKSQPDLAMVDGQGIAHPRRIGYASHLGLFLDIPTIGCAKSRLIGEHAELAEDPGASAVLRDKNGEQIGIVVRTKKGCKPLYVSIGHKIDLSSAVEWVLKCVKGYRIPEPTRLAHLASRGEVGKLITGN